MNRIRRRYRVVGAVALVTAGVWLASEQRAQSASGVAGNIDWMADGNCNHPMQPQCRFEYMSYKYCCYLDPSPLTTLARNDYSANEVVARAVLTAVAHGDKYKTVAYLALGQCHNPAARDELNNNKREAYEYLMANYVAAFRDDNPEKPSGNGQAFKLRDQPYKEDDLDGCVEKDQISLLAIPRGLAVRVCDEQSGDDDGGDGCLVFGPGVHTVGKLNDEISYVRVFRQ